MSTFKEAQPDSRATPLWLMVSSFAVLAGLVFARSQSGLAALIVALTILCFWTGIDLRTGAAALAKAWPLLAITWAIHMLVSPRISGSFITSLNAGFTFSSALSSAFFTLRLALILLAGVVFFRAHPPQAYARAIGHALSRLPFRWFRSGRIELHLTLALGSIPVLEREYRRLQQALIARGDLPCGGVGQKLRRAQRLLFALIVNGLRRADQVSLALEARGFDPHVKRTHAAHEPAGFKQVAVALLIVALSCVAPWL